MSRGHGKLQRSLLALLAKRERRAGRDDVAAGIDTIELAHRAYGKGKPSVWFKLTSTAQEVATRRALTALAREGEAVCLGSNLGPGRRLRWRFNVAKPRKRT